MKAESDVSGCLNDSLYNLRDVFIFKSEQMIATNGLLEFDKRQSIGNKSLAIREIDVDVVNLETRQIMKAQMRDGRDESINLFEMRFSAGAISANLMKQIGKEARVNFATTLNIIRVARHATAGIFAHPLQIMRIVSAKFKLASIPRPKALALRAKHLVAPLGLVNKHLAIRTMFCIPLQQSDRRERVGIANMCLIIPGGL